MYRTIYSSLGPIRKKPVLYGLLALFIMVLAYNCSNVQMAGSISETTNGAVYGSIVNPDGTPAAHTQVTMIPASYDPGNDGSVQYIFHDTTDENGTFTFARVDTGNYNIQAISLHASTRTLITGIKINNDTVPIAPRTLQKPGSIKVILPDSLDINNGYIYVPGTTFFSFLSGSNGVSVIDSVPAEIVPAACYAVKNTFVRKVFRYNVPVPSGDTIIIFNTAWPYAKQLFLNTSASGANVLGTVENFPVLVRLSADNFNFNQSQKNGNDIRFTKPDRTPLPFEIERWDSANGHAEIWVKADTIFGNTNSRYILMYWGNQNAMTASSGSNVFDTAKGFGGVWHLNEAAGDVFDATGNRNTGMNEGTTSGPGIIGAARVFGNNRITLGTSRTLCGLTDSITVSGWLNTIQVSPTSISVIRNQNHFTALQFDSGHAWTSMFNTLPYQWTSVIFRWNGVFNDGQWHYFVSRFKAGSGCRVYRDGELLAENNTDTAALTSTTVSFILGAAERNVEYYLGYLDEIRIERNCRSDDWIKLCYRNQNADNKLVLFR
jgi:hypothetical protein